MTYRQTCYGAVSKAAALCGIVLILALPVAVHAASPEPTTTDAPANQTRSPTVPPLTKAIAAMILGPATGLGVVYLMFSAPLLERRRDPNGRAA